ncbi:PREDICTED: probable apyrase 6 [Nelumbo nucifera]|uniref:Probable apyrase 6 n=1 Tax=Nelumbo nucifera TaxID=4432 RepID=A0A1U8B8G0_NELNU|nr:PREDICTED: probable apyrase 6 [Nelumbo nucifera]
MNSKSIDLPQYSHLSFYLRFFRLPETTLLSNLMLIGQQFCEEGWSALKKKYSSLYEDDLVRYCFSSSYIVALLHDTLGISLDDQRLM